MIASTLGMLAALALSLVAAEPDPKLRVAQSQAQACVEATVKGDFGAVADLTHPKIVATIGGRQKMIERAREAREKLEQGGVTFVSAQAGTPDSLQSAETALYCFVPLTLRMKTADGRVSVKSALLGVSFDDGKNWKFLDVSQGEAGVRKLVPEIPKALKFPPAVDAQLDSNP